MSAIIVDMVNALPGAAGDKTLPELLAEACEAETQLAATLRRLLDGKPRTVSAFSSAL